MLIFTATEGAEKNIIPYGLKMPLFLFSVKVASPERRIKLKVISHEVFRLMPFRNN